MKHLGRYIVVFFLIVGILFGPNYYLFGLSLRVICSSVALVLLMLNNKYIVLDKFIIIYLLYILWYIIVCFFNGQINDEYTAKALLNWHLPCILLYLLVPCYVRTQAQLYRVCILLVALLLFDVSLTLGQFGNIQVAWKIGNAINAYAAETNEFFLDRYDVSQGFIGMSIINGMCASVVDNGYFIATFFPLLLVLNQKKHNQQGSKFVVYFLMFITAIASFATQQRMGFYLIILFLVFYFWYSSNSFSRVFTVLISALLIMATEYLISRVELGRIADAGDAARVDSYLSSIHMIFNDPKLFWVGGENYYRQFFDHTPHNTIIGAWVYSGVIGFVIFCILLINILKRLLVSLRRLNRDHVILNSLAAGCLIFIFYSMTHSTGIHNGKALYFWLLFGLFNKYHSLLKSE